APAWRAESSPARRTSGSTTDGPPGGSAAGSSRRPGRQLVGPGSVGNEQTGNGYGAGGSASASGIQSGAGLIRPEEMRLPTGSISDTPPRCTFAGHPRFVSPATSGGGHIPVGGRRLRLEPPEP